MNRSHFKKYSPVLDYTPWANLGASHYGRQVEKTLDKLSSKGQGGNPLKYTNCKLCIGLDRKICPLEEILGFH
jgi:hypothetical protein